MGKVFITVVLSLSVAILIPQSKRSVDPARRAANHPVQQNVWRHLQPLHSSRKDVERVLGSDPLVSGAWHIYREPDEAISIRYVREACGSKAGVWNVPIDTVENIEVTPMKAVLPTDLKFELNEFRKIESIHPKNVFQYVLLGSGVVINTRLRGDREEVMSIEYGPTSKDNDLRCPDRPL